MLDLHGKQKQQKRTNTFFEFCNAKQGTLICTDVAARGLDVCQLPFYPDVCLCYTRLTFSRFLLWTGLSSSTPQMTLVTTFTVLVVQPVDPTERDAV